MAVQGKLVPQDPNDEPASILLERIRAEKQRLIKEGKIKKDKNESVIYRVPREENDGTDNLPYSFVEQIADGTVRDITDELPFDVPESWEWVRMGDVFNTIMGQSPDGKSVSETDTGIEFHQGKVFFTNCIISQSNQSTSEPTKIAPANSVLLCVRAPVGKVNITNRELCIGRGLCALQPLVEMTIDFVFRLLETYENIFVKQATGTTFVAVTGEIVKNQIIPLPPLAEQRRIVERIEQLLPHIAAYDDAEQKLTILNATFPDKLKKSILQAAVQGKLVPQDPHDEPADVLLEHIRAEREQLIRDGKIKRNKDESVIFRRDNSHYEIRGGVERCIDDEIPFDLPDTWAWVRLDYLCEYIQRGKSPKYSLIKKYPVIAQKCNQWNGFRIDKAQFIEPDSLASYAPERILHDGDLLWNSTGLGTLGRIAVYKTALNPYECAVADSHVTVIRPLINYVLSEYLYAYFANPTVQTVIESHSDGTTKQKELATITIKNYFIPLPPLNEQRRIVAQIDAVLPILDNL